MKKIDLIGVWKLVRYAIYCDNGKKIIYPYGEDSIGYLIYTLDDYVSVHIMRAHRNNRFSNDKQDTDLQRKIEIADNYGGYIGRYEIQNNIVTHYPLASGFVNYLNIPQKRQFQLYNNHLILEHLYDEVEHGYHGKPRLTWEKEIKNNNIEQ